MLSTLKSPLRELRWQLRRGRQWLRYRKLDAPAFFANSFPKSGTHLLTQVLSGFTQLGPVVDSGLPAIANFEGSTGKPVPVNELVKKVSRLRPGDIGYGHLHAYPEVVAVLCQEGWAPFFIFRDPRDVVVSHVFYVTELEPNHVHHDYYATQLSSFEERLQVSILGRPELDIPFPGIAERFAPYLPWLERPEVLCLRFEDFITRQEETLSRVFDHAVSRGLKLKTSREEAIAVLGRSIDPQRSPTFRSGRVGGWKEHFTPEITTLFKQEAGDLLTRLGYEKDGDWQP